MNMSLNLLAILVSLAMMITGASGAQPGETVANVSTISNFTLSVDGRSVTLEPTIRAGVQTDGETALFDIALESHGQELFPIQLAVDNDALTVAFLKCGQGLRIPESALAEQMTLSNADSAQTAEVMQMFNSLGDFYGAMASMAQLANDPEALKAAQADIAQAVKAAVDRGEGEATILPVEGVDTDAVKYTYQLGNAELCAALEAACAASQLHTHSFRGRNFHATAAE